MVEHLITVRSVPHGGPIELFLIPASVSMTGHGMYCLVCGDGAYKRTHAANWKV